MNRFFLAIVALAIFVTSSAVGADASRHGSAHRHISGNLHRRRKTTKHRRLAKHHRRRKHHRGFKKKVPVKHPAAKHLTGTPPVQTPPGGTPPTPAPLMPVPPTPAPILPGSPAPHPGGPEGTPPPTEGPVAPPPVKATLVGDSKVQADADTDSAGSAEAFEYTALADGTVNSLSLYVATGSSATSIVVGLYSNTAGRPGTLLTSATISSPHVGAWNTVNVSPVTVSAGSIYWLAALAPGGELVLRDLESGGRPAQESRSSSLSALPSPWTGGKTYANSPASFYASGTAATPPPVGPKASFTYRPASPAVGQAVEFDGTSSTCPDGPCTYEWSNDGGPTQPIPPIFPLGSGQTISLTFSTAGTEYVRLQVTDVLGQTATTEQNVTVAANGAQRTGCFAQPSACGYPDATNTGVPAGTPLQAKSGKIVVTTPGTTVKDVALNGEIAVDANNTTIEDDEITIDGSQRGCSEPCNGHGIQVEGEVTGTVVKHVTCHGGSAEGENASEFCMKNYSGESVNVSYMDDYNVGACWWGEGTYENNYCFVNAVIPEEHYEAIYYGGGKELKMNHNTMFSNKDQTAVVFASVDFHNQETITLTNNFMAGGGFVIYGGGSGSGGRVIGPVTISDNRFARCLTPEVQAENGHHLCKDGPDVHGYYPNGGSYGLTSEMDEAVTTYSGNYWDDNLEPVL